MIDKVFLENCVACFDNENWQSNLTEFIKIRNRSAVLRIHNMSVIICYLKTILLVHGIGAKKVVFFS